MALQQLLNTLADHSLPAPLVLGRLDFNYYEIASATVGGAGIFEIHYGGSMWSYTGTPCTDNNYDLICPGWVQLDGNSNSSTLAIGASSLYQKWQNGAIWQYTGPPCNSTTCPGWMAIGDNPNTAQIAAGGNNLYQPVSDANRRFNLAIHRAALQWEHLLWLGEAG
jgi:hypothetical protein